MGLWAVWGPSSWGALEPSWTSLSLSRGHLGGLLGHLGPSWAVFGPSWGHPEPSGGDLGVGASSAVLGFRKPDKARTRTAFKHLEELDELDIFGPGGPLGALLGRLEGLLSSLEAVPDRFEAALGRLGDLMRTWRPPGPPWAVLETIFDHLGPSWGPSWRPSWASWKQIELLCVFFFRAACGLSRGPPGNV